MINILSLSCEIAVRWMPQNFIDNNDNKQHQLKQWLGVARQQAIKWSNVDLDVCRHIGSPSL